MDKGCDTHEKCRNVFSVRMKSTRLPIMTEVYMRRELAGCHFDCDHHVCGWPIGQGGRRVMWVLGFSM